MYIDVKLYNNSISCLYLNKSNFKINICKIKHIYIWLLFIIMVIIAYIWVLLKELFVVIIINIIYYIKVLLILINIWKYKRIKNHTEKININTLYLFL